MRKVLQSVFPCRCSHSFVTRFLLGFISIILYFVCLFLFLFLLLFIYFLFFCGKDDVLFPNAVERNFQSFNLSSAVQYHNQSFHDTRTSISAKSFRPQSSPYFLQAKNARIIERTNGLEQNKRSFPLIWSKRGGRVSETEERSEKYVLIKTIETVKEKRKEKKKGKKIQFLSRQYYQIRSC